MAESFGTLDVYIVCVFISGPLAAIVLSFIISFMILRWINARDGQHAITMDKSVSSTHFNDSSFQQKPTPQPPARPQPAIPQAPQADYPPASQGRTSRSGAVPPPLPSGPAPPVSSRDYPGATPPVAAPDYPGSPHIGMPSLPPKPVPIMPSSPPPPMPPKPWNAVGPSAGGSSDIYDMAENNAHMLQQPITLPAHSADTPVDLYDMAERQEHNIHVQDEDTYDFTS